MNILIASLQNEELEEGEIAGIALSILDGRAEIKGTYPDGDYRLEYLEVQDEKWKLGNLIDKIARELEQQKKEKQTLLKKYLFVLDSLEEWEKRSLNDEYFEECCTLKIPSFTAHSIGSTSIASHILKYSETSIFLCPFRSCPMICGDTPIFSATNPCFIPFSFMHSFNVFPSIPFSPSFRNSTFR